LILGALVEVLISTMITSCGAWVMEHAPWINALQTPGGSMVYGLYRYGLRFRMFHDFIKHAASKPVVLSAEALLIVFQTVIFGAAIYLLISLTGRIRGPRRRVEGGR
jgi:hypothetical protein